MKKIVPFILAVILLSSCLGITSFAADLTVTFSEDFGTLYANDTTYSMVDPANLLQYREASRKNVALSPTQEETVKKVNLYADWVDEKVFFAEIMYKNGATLSVAYLRDDLLDEYTKLLNSDIENYMIDFMWPDGNTVTAKKELLFGEKVTLSSRKLQSVDCWDVFAESSIELFQAYTGSMLTYGDEYYYVDFKEIGFSPDEFYSFAPYDYESLEVHKITDANLIKSLSDAENKFYDDDLGFFYDDDFTEQISAVFIVFVFAVIPLAVFILFLIFAIRSKTIYRKLYAIISIISAAELVVFTVLTIMINVLPK